MSSDRSNQHSQSGDDTSSPRMSSDNSSQSSRPEAQAGFPLFSLLPPELRTTIWEEALGQENFVGDDEFLHAFHATSPNAVSIRQVNAEAREVARRRHTHRFINHGGETVYFDARKDIFVVILGQLPLSQLIEARPQPDGMMMRALPMERVLMHEPRMPKLGHRHNTGTFVPALDLSSFHNLREFSFSGGLFYFQKPDEFWLQGWQHHGPDPANHPGDCVWHQGPHEQAILNSAAYFDALGIQGDTGIRWPYNPIDLLPEWEHGVPPRGPAWLLNFRPNGWYTHLWRRYGTKGLEDLLNQVGPVMPRIGFHAYSMSDLSAGGQWAGFRYFVETQRVEFTPLAFYEVEHILFPGEEVHSQLPEFISKVWIVRPGDTPPNAPHHAWEEFNLVGSTGDKNVDLDRIVLKRIWGMIRNKISYFWANAHDTQNYILHH